MPDYAPEILTAAAEAISQEMRASRDVEPDRMARAALDAAAPLLADAVARRIRVHMDEHFPATDVANMAPRRCFRIAIQVASRAFSTREDELRAVADAVIRGEYIHCNPEAAMLAAAESDGLLPDALPEDGVPRD